MWTRVGAATALALAAQAKGRQRNGGPRPCRLEGVPAFAATTPEDFQRWAGHLEKRARAALASASDSRRPVAVYVTGFGKFGKVLDNPSAALCRRLASRKEELAAEGVELADVEVLEVSAETCRRKAAEIAGTIAERPGNVVILHLGVAVGRKRLSLECRAANVAHFPIPDARGWVADRQPVVDGAAAHEHTILPVSELLCAVRDAGADAEISTDAGTYICNYIYFSSLAAAAASSTPVLFVHVPAFADVCEEDQLRGLEALLRALRDAANGSLAGAPVALTSAKATTH